MQHPDSAMIGPIKYDIRWEDRLGYDGERCHGTATFVDLLIRVDSVQSLSVQQITLLHELFHAMIHESGVGEVMDEEQEEMIVRTLSLMTHQLLHSSPEIADFLTCVEEFEEGEGRAGTALLDG